MVVWRCSYPTVVVRAEAAAVVQVVILAVPAADRYSIWRLKMLLLRADWL